MMAADRPILFSAPMIRAILDGRKTQTRRILTAHNSEFGSAPRDYWLHADFARASPDGKPESGMYLHVPCHREFEPKVPEPDCPRCTEMGWEGTRHRLWPRIVPGHRLWVREAHAFVGSVDPGWFLYRASGYEAECDRHGFDKPYPPESTVRWRPGIHMPRWASRLTLLVTAVRVQRLHDISENDAQAEGVEQDSDGWRDYEMPATQCCTDARDSFATLWRSINGAESWAANPWVAAISFDVIRANIDTLPRPARELVEPTP